jgi:D-alanyl-D-alanine carboxypeptidase
MTIMVVLNKINSRKIELIERVRVKENYKSKGWNLADKDIVDIKQYFVLDYDTYLEMIEIKD